MLTLSRRKWRLAFGFRLSQLSCPQQNLCEAFWGHVSVGRVHVLTLKDKMKRRKSDEHNICICSVQGASEKEAQIRKDVTGCPNSSGDRWVMR